MGYRKSTPNERQKKGAKRTAELAGILRNGYPAMARPDVWAAVMRAGAVHRDRGPVNCIAVALQAPTATRVRSLGKWQEEGRQVRKGESSIRIWGPTRGKLPAADQDQPEPAADTAPPHDGAARKASGWVSNGVFDISQTDTTDGAERPAAPAPCCSPARLFGTLTDMSDDTAPLPGGVLLADAEPQDAARALLLRAARRDIEGTGLCPGEQMEAEAAAAAHVAARILHLPAVPLTPPPAAEWLTEDLNNPPVKASAVRAITVGRALAEQIEDAAHGAVPHQPNPVQA